MPIILRRVLPVLLGLAASCAAQAQGFEARCASELQSRFEVTSSSAGYAVDNTVATKVLHNRAVHNSAGDMMLGLTSATSRIEVGIDGHVLQDPGSGRECLAPRISVDLRYLPLQVYVAREFSPSGCPYRAVLDHEMEHVNLYLQHLPKVAGLVRQELEKRYRGAPLYAASGMGLDTLADQVDAWLWPLIKSEMQRVEIYQKAFDSDEESFRLSAACQGELGLNLRSRY
ncbi:hypothetical protein [Massilia sp. YIM B04103]|uniref:hypothetical protein n=1 Tax=Massilia sp. YIM B04103 TaxID=2963106 RepID=UPI00210DB254|nr:hypothetical protein [Massilia sp. YIM B04103]